MQVQLVFFSTFEDSDLPDSSPMKNRGISKYYEPSLMPTLYICPIANVLALDAPVSLSLTLHQPSHTSSVCITNHPLHQPSHTSSVPRRPCGCIRQVRQEGQQRLRGEHMAVAVWAGRASSGGSVSG